MSNICCHCSPQECALSLSLSEGADGNISYVSALSQNLFLQMSYYLPYLSAEFLSFVLAFPKCVSFLCEVVLSCPACDQQQHFVWKYTCRQNLNKLFSCGRIDCSNVGEFIFSKFKVPPLRPVLLSTLNILLKNYIHHFSLSISGASTVATLYFTFSMGSPEVTPEKLAYVQE